MPTTDPYERRAFANAQKRRFTNVAQLAESVNEYAAYLLRDVQSGQHRLADGYARKIASDIEEMRLAMSALDALSDLEFIVSDEED